MIAFFRRDRLIELRFDNVVIYGFNEYRIAMNTMILIGMGFLVFSTWLLLFYKSNSTALIKIGGKP